MVQRRIEPPKSIAHAPTTLRSRNSLSTQSITPHINGLPSDRDMRSKIVGTALCVVDHSCQPRTVMRLPLSEKRIRAVIFNHC